VFPHLGVLVSGGHSEILVVEDHGSYRLLGATRDDAAGEAFDKVGKLLGFSYPAGAQIDALAATGNGAAIAFPRAMRGRGYDLSFSDSRRRSPSICAPTECRRDRRSPICARASRPRSSTRSRRRSSAPSSTKGSRSSCSPAASRRTAGCVRACGCVRAPRCAPVRAAAVALHRQRRDDRLRGLFPAAAGRTIGARPQRRRLATARCEAHARKRARARDGRSHERRTIGPRAPAALPAAREEELGTELPRRRTRVSRDRERAAPGPKSWVVEVGAGLGTLTYRLAEVAGQVLAIERDRDLCAMLREELGAPKEGLCRSSCARPTR